jgi:predicted ATPase/class 3 adenylate cyclase
MTQRSSHPEPGPRPSPRADVSLPTGTITFLRSDIEGSMELSRALGPRFDELNDTHAAMVRAAVDAHRGRVVRTEGDAFFAVFTEAAAAARAAIDIQRALTAHPWPDGHALRVRVGLHTGSAYRAGDDYGGLEVSRAARIAAMAWGGQIVLSDAVRALLAEDLSGDWSVRDLGRHRLKGIVEPERIFQLEAPGIARDFPLLRGPVGDEHLPPRLTSLVGREAELEALADLLRSTRLLTLTGAGGTGKTTLALELARREAVDYEDGARFVDLHSVRQPEALEAELAHALGLLDGPTGSAADRLTGYLAEREVLLVIDNFEQVLAAAHAVGGLLRAAPRTRVIVTSRIPLRLSAEQEYAVRPLAVEASGPDVQPEAVRLFLARARQVRPGLALDDSEREAVTALCRLVDGLPLAIELCAARAGTLPLRVIRDRLVARLPLPGSAPRDMPARQRTIDDTVAWSHELLNAPLRRLFARLAVFEGSFDLEQAEAACGPADEPGTDVLGGLVTLVEHSLLLRVDDSADGLRFRMLGPIRAWALERLAASGEEREMRQRHARAFADLAERAARHLPGGEQARWLDRLESDDANLRVATRWAIDGQDVAVALRLAASLWRYWLQTGRLVEGRQLVASAVALPGAEEPTRLRVRALDAAAGVAYWSGDVLRADALYEEELALAQRLGDQEGEALAWLDLYFTREFKGDEASAREARARAEAIYRRLDDRIGLARIATATPITVLARGLTDTASLPDLGALASRLEAEADAWVRAQAPVFRALESWLDGDVPSATRWLVQGLREGLRHRERHEVALGTGLLVIVAQALGRPEAGAAAHGARLVAMEQLGIRPPASYAEIAGDDPLPALTEALGEEGFAAAVERGRRMSIEEVIDLFDVPAG